MKKIAETKVGPKYQQTIFKDMQAFLLHDILICVYSLLTDIPLRYVWNTNTTLLRICEVTL